MRLDPESLLRLQTGFAGMRGFPSPEKKPESKHGLISRMICDNR